ncbi:Phosphoglucose isomerase (PGI) [Candidatus Nanopelagicaceae bacterium]
MTIKVSGASLARVDRTSARYAFLREVHQKIAAKDSTTWGPEAAAEAAIRLNWVDLPTSSMALREEVTAVAARFSDKKSVVLCGMGGSSLAPEVLSKTYKREIIIVDSTDPNYIAHALNGELSSTVFVVSSKSGSTIETSSQRALFEAKVVEAGLNPIDHIVFVTDPGSPLDVETRGNGFTVINADPNVGGRFSALSAFGVVPAVLAGIDIWKVLDDAAIAKGHFLAFDEVILDVAYLLSEVAGQYIGFTDHGSEVPGISDWIEQLIAESTGKDGKGRLPIVAESVAAAEVGNPFTIAFADAAADLNVVAPLGAHFIFWEWVTAILGAALEIDPFNQPNVTEAKEQTLALLAEWKSSGTTILPLLVPDASEGDVEIFGAGATITQSLQEIIATVADGGFISIMAYLNRKDDVALEELRALISSASGKPTTFGWGPRFMHSTGQFHKAGQPNGTFIQITGEVDCDFEIPGRDFSFATLVAAQGLGDGKALAKRQYPLLRLHLKNRSAGIEEILRAARAL